MVARNRKFSIPHGYSRRTSKHDAERLVAEDLEVETENRMLRDGVAGPLSNSHVALELGPPGMPSGGIDLRAVLGQAARREHPALAAARRHGRALLQLGRQWGRGLLRLGRRQGERLLRLSRRQGERLLAWVSWR